LREVALFPEQDQNRACLCHRLNRQNARHHRGAWKMTIEKRLVNADIFQRNDSFILIDLEHTIDQKKRIPMRKNPHDLGDSKFVHYFLAGSVAFGAAAAGAAAGFVGVASMRRMTSVVISATS